jgi:hypothetical protein
VRGRRGALPWSTCGGNSARVCYGELTQGLQGGRFYPQERIESDQAQIEELNSTMLGILLHARSSGGRQQENRRIPTTVLEEASATWDPHVSEIPWRSQSWPRRVIHWADAQGFGWVEDRRSLAQAQEILFFFSIPLSFLFQFQISNSNSNPCLNFQISTFNI